ncbi:MAG: hypothetical protein ACSLFI_05235 [Solirubrobacterales bacterium]
MKVRPETKSLNRFALLLGGAFMTTCLVAALALTPSAQAVPKAPKGMLGIVPQAIPTRADTRRMKLGGIETLRTPVAWNSVQSVNSNDFNWEPLDNTVRVAAREGVRVMPFLYGTPSWLSGRPTNMPVESKHQMNKWRDFVRAAVVRYGSDGKFWDEPKQADSDLPKTPIREWQVWNEANFHYFTTPVSPAKYGRLLDAAGRVIHQTDKKAEVIASGLFAKPKGPSRKAMDATTYIKRLAKYSLSRSIDSIAIHPYSADTATLKKTMRDFRRAAISAGYRKKSIQITEIGWASGPKKNAFLTGSKTAQARQLRSAFDFLVGERRSLRLKNIYWYSWRDLPASAQTCSFCYTIGLFAHRDSGKLVPKPAWNQFVRFTRGKA